MDFSLIALKLKKICEKAILEGPAMLEYCPDRCKTQEICEKAVFEEHDLLEYCLVKYKTQLMCEKAIDLFLSPLKFFLIFIITKKLKDLEKFYKKIYVE